MLRYPLDPSHARILIASLQKDRGCVNEIIDILSLADAGHLWIDKQNERDQAAEARAKFISIDGDHLTALNVFRAFLELRESTANGNGNGDKKGMGKLPAAVTRWARENYINTKTLAQALKVRAQLRELVKREGHHPDESCGREYDVVRRCLLAGLFMNTAVIQSDKTFRQTAGTLVSPMSMSV